MTKPKMKPLRLDVHVTLNDKQFEKLMKAFDQLAVAFGHKEAKQ